jgi:hypothetical protein
MTQIGIANKSKVRKNYLEVTQAATYTGIYYLHNFRSLMVPLKPVITASTLRYSVLRGDFFNALRKMISRQPVHFTSSSYST